MPGSSLFVWSHALFNLICWAVHLFLWPPAILGAVFSSWTFAFLVLIGLYEKYEEVNVFQKMFCVASIVLIPLFQTLSLVEIEWVDANRLFGVALYAFAPAIIIGLVLSYFNRGLKFYRWRDTLSAIVSLFGLSVIFIAILNQSFQLHARWGYKALVREKRIDSIVRAGTRHRIVIRPDTDETIRKFEVTAKQYESLKSGDYVLICRYEGLLKIESFWLCSQQ